MKYLHIDKLNYPEDSNLKIHYNQNLYLLLLNGVIQGYITCPDNVTKKN